MPTFHTLLHKTVIKENNPLTQHEQYHCDRLELKANTSTHNQYGT